MYCTIVMTAPLSWRLCLCPTPWRHLAARIVTVAYAWAPLLGGLALTPLSA